MSKSSRSSTRLRTITARARSLFPALPAAACLLCSALCLPAGAQRGSASYVAQYYLGHRSLTSHHFSAAAYHFRMALEWKHKSADAHLGLGNVYLRTGKLNKALEEFNAALFLEPTSADAEQWVRLAREAIKNSAEDRPLHDMEALAKSDPKNSDVHAAYAEELIERNRIEEAQKEAELALKLDKRQGNAYCALGRIAFKQGRDVEAQKLLESAIHCDNTDDDALSNLGDLAMKAKNYSLASSYYKRIIAIVPEEAEGHKKYMESLTAQGDASRANAEKATIERLTPKN